ncbi:MAG: YHS domain-containing protein [Thermotaleaceae bacterium]
MPELKDLVCGMVIEVNDLTLRNHYKGNDYYFCSGQCLVKFTSDPQAYISEPRHCCREKQTSDHFDSHHEHHHAHCQNGHKHHHGQCCQHKH